jgi:hypothetical protein
MHRFCLAQLTSARALASNGLGTLLIGPEVYKGVHLETTGC